MTKKAPAVYVLASARNGTLYVGVTSNLVQRVWQHREGRLEGFTRRYGVKTLVWYEQHESMESAIAREKAIKKWNRAWKLALIEQGNPDWQDLWPEITGLDIHDSLECRHSRDASFRVLSSVRGHPEGAIVDENFLDSRLRGNDENERESRSDGHERKVGNDGDVRKGGNDSGGKI